jgi:hypothetical protein
VHQAERGRVNLQRRTERDGRFDPPPHERLVGDALAVDQHAQRDLRSIAEQRRPQHLAARAADLDDVAGGGARIGDVSAVDPRVATAQPFFAPR